MKSIYIYSYTKVYFTVLLIFILGRLDLYAHLKDSNKLHLQVLPSAFYTPETRIGIGASIYSFFKLDDNSITKKSNAQTYITASLNKQFSFENDYMLWFNKNKYLLIGSLDFSRFPELFFGIGNETSVMDPIVISFDIVKIKNKFLLKIHRNIYAGLILQYQKMYNETIEVSSKIMMNEIFGTMGYDTKGIGPILMIDKRDNPMNPANGYFVDINYINSNNDLNKKYKFSSFSFDARKYLTLFKKIIWNGNIHGEFTSGQVPFRMLPELGGARFLRGFYRGRFRDNNLMVIQNEVRMTVYKRIGIAAFGGIGEVANTINEFKTNQLHYNCGVGLRFKINKKENANLRIDYGLTKDSRGLYVVFAEAF